MEFDELESGWILKSRLPHEIHYELSKLYECLYGTKHDFLYNYHFERVSNFLKEYVTINPDMERHEIFLLIKAALHTYWIEHDMKK